MKPLRNAVATLFFSVACIATPAVAATIMPPVGYVRIAQDFGDGAPPELSELAYNFRFNTFSDDQGGTFWSNTFTMTNSENNALFPENYGGGQQGGYLGLQKLTDGTDLAIFSIFWALDARSSAPGAQVVNDIEMWYLDDAPFDPPINSLADVDTSRVTAGGPFSSVRLEVDLEPGDTYALRMQETVDAGETWWLATLENLTAATAVTLGEIQVPDNWGGINPDTVGGFVEHFGPLPNGCASIPDSDATFFAATGPNGLSSTPSASVYGACEADIAARTTLECDGDACNVVVASAAIAAPPTAALLLGVAGLLGFRCAATHVRCANNVGAHAKQPVRPNTASRSQQEVDIVTG